MDISKQVFNAVAKKFCINGEILDITPMTSGNINRTFKVTVNGVNGEEMYVFQRINTFVFKQPTYIMSNIGYVTGFIADKLKKNNLSDDQVLHFLNTDE